MTEILATQPWAITCAWNSVPDLRDGFYCGQDTAGSIDAPEFMPSGCTVENVLSGYKNADCNGRFVIGGLVHRD